MAFIGVRLDKELKTNSSYLKNKTVRKNPNYNGYVDSGVDAIIAATAAKINLIKRDVTTAADGDTKLNQCPVKLATLLKEGASRFYIHSGTNPLWVVNGDVYTFNNDAQAISFVESLGAYVADKLIGDEQVKVNLSDAKTTLLASQKTAVQARYTSKINAINT